MDTTGKFFAFIGIAVTLYLSFKGIMAMKSEQEEKIKEAHADGFRSASKT